MATISTAAWAQEKLATVTFFRENQSQFKHDERYKKDFLGMGFHWPIYMDGLMLLTLRRDRMATFSIPAGHHEFKTDKSERLSIDITPGSHLFIRPVMSNKEHSLTAVLTLNEVNCTDFVNRTEDIKPVKPEDIFSGKLEPEQPFARLCAATTVP